MYLLVDDQPREVRRVESEKKFVVRAEEAQERASRFSHPWNPNSELYATRLSSRVGLSRVGISRVRVPAGKESFVYHSNHREEEWIYVLSGRGVAEIDGEEYEVGAGDFMGFGRRRSSPGRTGPRGTPTLCRPRRGSSPPRVRRPSSQTVPGPHGRRPGGTRPDTINNDREV